MEDIKSELEQLLEEEKQALMIMMIMMIIMVISRLRGTRR